VDVGALVVRTEAGWPVVERAVVGAERRVQPVERAAQRSVQLRLRLQQQAGLLRLSGEEGSRLLHEHGKLLAARVSNHLAERVAACRAQLPAGRLPPNAELCTLCAAASAGSAGAARVARVLLGDAKAERPPAEVDVGQLLHCGDRCRVVHILHKRKPLALLGGVVDDDAQLDDRADLGK